MKGEHFCNFSKHPTRDLYKIRCFAGMGRLETPGTPPLIADLWSRCCGRDLGFLVAPFSGHYSFMTWGRNFQVSCFFGSNREKSEKRLGLVRYFVEWGEDCGSEWCGFHVCCCCFFSQSSLQLDMLGLVFFKKNMSCVFQVVQSMYACILLSLCVFLSFLFRFDPMAFITMNKKHHLGQCIFICFPTALQATS